MSERPRCQAAIYKRDTYRHSGGRQHFKLHYTRAQCSRAAKIGDLCAVHAKWPNCGRAGYHATMARGTRRRGADAVKRKPKTVTLDAATAARLRRKARRVAVFSGRPVLAVARDGLALARDLLRVLDG